MGEETFQQIPFNPLLFEPIFSIFFILLSQVHILPTKIVEEIFKVFYQEYLLK